MNNKLITIKNGRYKTPKNMVYKLLAFVPQNVNAQRFSKDDDKIGIAINSTINNLKKLFTIIRILIYIANSSNAHIFQSKNN